MIHVAKIPANLVKPCQAAGSLAIRGIYEQVAYIGQGETVFALQNPSVTLTPISLALDGRIDFRERLSAGLTGRMDHGVMTLGDLTIDLRQAAPVDMSLNRAPDSVLIRNRIPEWHGMVQTVMMDALAEKAVIGAGLPRDGSRPDSGNDTAPEVLGIGDLLIGLRGLQPLPLPARARAGVDIRGAFVRQLNRFLEHAARPDRRLETLAEDIAGIIGLGPGLTPSGDDFLIGLLSVLGFLYDGPAGERLTDTGPSQAQPVFPAAAFLDPLRLAIQARLSGTTLVSAAFLREATDGRFNENLKSHFASLAAGDLEQARRPLAAVAGAGHSSGTDTLGGMLLGLALASADRRG